MIHAKRLFLLTALLIGTSHIIQAGIIRTTAVAATMAVLCCATWVLARGIETKESENVPMHVKIGNFEANLNAGKNWLHCFDVKVMEGIEKAKEIKKTWWNK